MAEDGAPESPARAEDDPSISDDDYVYRRIARDPVNTKQEGDGVRASSAAFEDKDDGISVFLESVMAGRGLRMPADVVHGKPVGRFVVARLSVRELRDLDCGITRDPDPPGEAPHPCNPAHALVHLPPIGKAASKRLRGRIARAAEILDPDDDA